MRKTYGRLKPKRNGDEVMWELSEVSPHVVIKFKQIFTKIKQTSTQPFYLKNTKETCCDLKWFSERYPLKMSKKTRTYLDKQSNRFVKEQEENFQLITGNYKAPVKVKFKDGKKLRPFQEVPVALFPRVKRFLIADEVGLGKTVEALGCLVNKNALPALVVVQAHLPEQWDEKTQEFTNLSTELIHTGKVHELKRADVVIVKYSIIAKWMDVLLDYGFKTFILDEVQEVRRIESRKHEACKAIADTVEHCLGLSGTPIVNYGDETYNLYSVIDQQIFPSQDEFRREWTGWGRCVQDPVALGSYLQEKCAYIRRTKEDVGSQIPPVNRIVHPVGFDQKAIDEVQERAKVLAHTILQGAFVEKGQASRELNVMIRKATGISKAKHVADYVKMILQNGEKVLLAVWHRAVYDIIEKELKDFNPVFYSGKESSAQKRKSKEAFINGESQLMVISLRSAVGLDGLQHVCSYVVIGEFDWTGAMHDQIIGRLYRDGQTKQVTAIFLASNSGSDPVVMDIIGLKKSQQDGIMNPFGKKQKQHSDDSIIKTFAQRLLNE